MLKSYMIFATLTVNSLLVAGEYEENQAKKPVPCAQGNDYKKEYAHFLVTKNAEKYLDCKKDSDCLFVHFQGGYISNNTGIPYLYYCITALTKKLFPDCARQDPGDFSKKRLEYQTFARVPNNIECKKNICTAVYQGKNRNWRKEYFDKGRNDFPHTVKQYDQICANFLKDPMASYKSLQERP